MGTGFRQSCRYLKQRCINIIYLLDFIQIKQQQKQTKLNMSFRSILAMFAAATLANASGLSSDCIIIDGKIVPNGPTKTGSLGNNFGIDGTLSGLSFGKSSGGANGNVVIGNGVQVRGNRNKIIGNQDLVLGNQNYMQGNDNKFYGSYSVVVGDGLDQSRNHVKIISVPQQAETQYNIVQVDGDTIGQTKSQDSTSPSAQLLRESLISSINQKLKNVESPNISNNLNQRLVGTQYVVNQSGSSLFGLKKPNVVSTGGANGNFVIGNNVNINGDYNNVYGDRDHINGNYNVLSGSRNYLRGDNTIINGNGLVIDNAKPLQTIQVKQNNFDSIKLVSPFQSSISDNSANLDNSFLQTNSFGGAYIQNVNSGNVPAKIVYVNSNNAAQNSVINSANNAVINSANNAVINSANNAVINSANNAAQNAALNAAQSSAVNQNVNNANVVRINYNNAGGNNIGSQTGTKYVYINDQNSGKGSNGNVVIGDNNQLKGDYSLLVGNDNYLRGNENKFVGNNGFVVGDNLNVKGNNINYIDTNGQINSNNQIIVDKPMSSKYNNQILNSSDALNNLSQILNGNSMLTAKGSTYATNSDINYGSNSPVPLLSGTVLNTPNYISQDSATSLRSGSNSIGSTTTKYIVTSQSQGTKLSGGANGNIVVGDNNELDGNNNILYGDSNLMQTHGSSLAGSSNYIAGKNNLLVGNQNVIVANNLNAKGDNIKYVEPVIKKEPIMRTIQAIP